MPKRALSSAGALARPKPVKRRIQNFAASAYRETILDAAERLFVKVGYRDARMSDLAGESGVSIGTLYNYFENKELVFASLLERVRREVTSALEQAVTASAADARLHAIVQTVLEHVERRGALFASCLQLGATTEHDIRRLGGEDAERGYLAYLELLRGALRDLQGSGGVRTDVEMDLLVGAIAGALNALTFHWLRSGGTGPLAGRARPMIELFLEGARAR